MNKFLKGKWAGKLMRSKFFVLLTDSEGVIALEGADPEMILDAVALDAQTAEIKLFRDRLDILAKDHKKATAKLRSKSVTTDGKKSSKTKRTPRP